MYSVDQNDRLYKLDNVPQSSIGAPCPLVYADEQTQLLAYYLEVPEIWDNSTGAIVEDNFSVDNVALITFNYCRAHYFGPPNDEAYSGHPLSARGLRPYSDFEVQNSSWIRALKRMNSAHPRHLPQRYAELCHYIFVFHDTTFECVAKEFSVVTFEGSVASVLSDAIRKSYDL